MTFRAGDTVRHRPTGETWVLACDQRGADVLPAGWPETLARADDCELLEAANDDERIAMLREAAYCSGYRGGLARVQLAAVNG